jgi:predicted RecB family nuclease
MTADTRLGAPVVLDAMTAAGCPVRTRHAYGPHPAEPSPAWPRIGADGIPGGRTGPDRESATHEIPERAAFVAEVVDRWLRLQPSAVDLRGLADRASATVAAVSAGVRVIIAPALPTDSGGHRTGSPDALVRDPTRTGTTAYWPVLIRWHRVLRHRGDVHRSPGQGPDGAPDAGHALAQHARPPEGPIPADAPLLAALQRPTTVDLPWSAQALRLDTRRADFLQLAHHYRLLEAAGWAGAPWGALIGTDQVPDDPALVWVPLDQAMIRVVEEHDAPDVWRISSLLECADAELARRVAIAGAVQAPGAHPSEVIRPVVVDECRTCPWWSRCRDELDPDDVSLRIARRRLDRTEVTALRRRGVITVGDLATADVEEMLPTYLSEVSHRPDAEQRLRTVARRARMLDRDEPIERETRGPITVPRAEIELDLDLETAATGRIYLWGFATHRDGMRRYVPFSRFADLDSAAEESLAREALGWLRDQVESTRSALVFHYSEFEVARIAALAARCPGDDLMAWAARFARSNFVDLLTIVQANFFGAAGLGLKQIAVAAGFSWRDPDPGGLNSQLWFDEAVHGTEPDARAAARRRVLAYNEDDVSATAQLRSWLRAQ